MTLILFSIGALYVAFGDTAKGVYFNLSAIFLLLYLKFVVFEPVQDADIMTNTEYLKQKGENSKQ
jgi:hypothetical protein